jgi:histidine triad (HIT) family protein
MSDSLFNLTPKAERTMSDDCLFCKIIAGEIPSDKVYSDDDVYAFHDINPVAPSHILIIPKKHLTDVKSADDSDQALLGKLLLKANEIARDQGLEEAGYRYVINTGCDGGQTVYHLHLHIIGGRSMGWPPG